MDENAKYYVLMFVADPDTGKVVTLVKNKGPSHLIGRITFPGGTIEPGETPERAASREMKEETGVSVRASEWIPIWRKSGPGWVMDVLAATSSKVHQARQMESEEVHIRDLKEAFKASLENPDAYAKDFVEIVVLSCSTLGLDPGGPPSPASKPFKRS
jgi:8-oxo-dGTP pyrophosphatase MutT (NUDIX family)